MMEPPADHTFQRLLAPLSVESFLGDLWDRRPALIERHDPSYYGDLLTLADIDHVVANDPSVVRVANARSEAPDWIASIERGDSEKLRPRLHDGSTLILDALQRRLPKLGRVCRSLDAELHVRTQMNVYLTPAHGTGFRPHFDDHDVFILQTLGTKQWRIARDRAVIPRKEDAKGKPPELGDAVLKLELRQGDLLYIPRGYVHQAESGSETAMHITLGIHSLTWEDLLRAGLRFASDRDDGFRRLIPLSFLARDRREVTARLRELLEPMTGDDFLGAFLERFSSELVSRFRTDLAGQVEAAFGADPLVGDQTVEPRLGLIYTLREDTDGVRLLVGTREIRFPDFLAEPVRFCLETPGYRVAEVPGDLAESEKILLVERLVQEGLVLRCNGD